MRLNLEGLAPDEEVSSVVPPETPALDAAVDEAYDNYLVEWASALLQAVSEEDPPIDQL